MMYFKVCKHLYKHFPHLYIPLGYSSQPSLTGGQCPVVGCQKDSKADVAHSLKLSLWPILPKL